MGGKSFALSDAPSDANTVGSIAGDKIHELTPFEIQTHAA